MSASRRQILLYSLLALTVLAALWPLPENGATPRVTPSVEAAAKPAAPITGQPAAKMGVEGEANGDLFPTQSWAPKPDPMAKPPAPEAPPLPFAFAGRYMEEGKLVVFLSSGDNLYSVSAGSELPGGWRLSETGPTQLSFSYQPLKLNRILPIGDLTP